MMIKYLLVFFISCVLLSCKNDDDYISISYQIDEELLELIVDASDDRGIDFFILPNETDYTQIPQDPLNPITAEKVSLGKMLVHETATGGNPKMEINKYMYACASCHPVASGFYSGLKQGISEGGIGFGISGEGRRMMSNNIMPRDSVDILPIKVPTLLNVAYQEVALWNGSLGGAGINAPYVAQNANSIPENLAGYQGLETQGIAGQKVHRLKIDNEFVNEFGYNAMFDAAFPDVPLNERYSSLSGALAIAAYNRTVLANKSPWQEYLRGDKKALSINQKEGAKIFFDKGQCIKCHTGPALKSMDFYAWGMGDLEIMGKTNLSSKSFNLLTTRGRAEFTGRAEDNYKFKVPTLYNLKDSKFYGHGSTFTSVREVIEYKNKGQSQNPQVPQVQLASQFGTINLTEDEIDKLTDFLENSLYDAELRRYAPQFVLSGNCIPNNDMQSRIDLGCN